MSLIKYILLGLISLSIVNGQGTMNSFGLGHYSFNQGITSAGNGLNFLVPSFQRNVSLVNPSTWHNLQYTYLSLSYSGDENTIDENTINNGYSGLSNAIWIIPIKKKGSLGLSLSPYSDQRISLVSQDTLSFTAFDSTFNYSNSFKRSGGIMAFKIGFSRLLNDKISIGFSGDFLFGSSRQNESIFFEGSSIIQTSRTNYSGVLGTFYLSSVFNEKFVLYASLKKSLKPLDGVYSKKYLFDDGNGNGYHDFSSPSDFPTPDSVSAYNDIRLDGIHNPSAYSFGIESNINKQSSLALEFKLLQDNGNVSDYLKFPANDWINESKYLNISYTKTPNDLSLNFSDKIGISIKNHNLYESKSTISEIGASLGLGFKFKIVDNQIDLNYYVGKRSYSDTYKTEIVQQIQVGVSLADIWFVKRRQKK